MTLEQLDALEALKNVPYSMYYSALINDAPELIAAARENQRLRDLVRHQRAELHEAGLIDDEEYAAIASDHAAVKRLETYDDLKADARTLEKLRPLLVRWKKERPTFENSAGDPLAAAIPAEWMEPRP